MEKTVMTLVGKRALEKELKKLLQVDRPQVIKDIEEARAHGDLSENAEYHAAKEQQGFITGRISEIKSKLGTAEVINPNQITTTERAAFSATVSLENQETGETKIYQIVGTDEADINNGKIGYQSPFARKMIGRFVGDEIEHVTPKGEQVWIITDVVFK